MWDLISHCCRQDGGGRVPLRHRGGQLAPAPQPELPHPPLTGSAQTRRRALRRDEHESKSVIIFFGWQKKSQSFTLSKIAGSSESCAKVRPARAGAAAVAPECGPTGGRSAAEERPTWHVHHQTRKQGRQGRLLRQRQGGAGYQQNTPTLICPLSSSANCIICQGLQHGCSVAVLSRDFCLMSQWPTVPGPHPPLQADEGDQRGVEDVGREVRKPTGVRSALQVKLHRIGGPGPDIPRHQGKETFENIDGHCRQSFCQWLLENSFT